MNKFINTKLLSGIQYVGRAGITRSCLKAIFRIIHFGDDIDEAILLTGASNSDFAARHCFLILTGNGEIIAIKSGFASSYAGEGPRGLAMALQILQKHEIKITECSVDQDIIQEIDASCLTEKNLERIVDMKNRREIDWYKRLF